MCSELSQQHEKQPEDLLEHVLLNAPEACNNNVTQYQDNLIVSAMLLATDHCILTAAVSLSRDHSRTTSQQPV